MVYFLGCVYVNHIYDNPGYFTCECTNFDNPCLSNGNCEVEVRCPDAQGEPTGIHLYELNFPKSNNLSINLYYILATIYYQ